MNNLEQKIEAILFFKGELISKKKISEILDVEVSEVDSALLSLKENLLNRGITLIENNTDIMLATASEYGELIENLQKEELNKELSKASLETLSIILYKNGVSRAELDYIRGVNSSFTLRALSVRGLIEKVQDPSDARKYIYKPTFELLGFMGVSKAEDLPEYQKIHTGMVDAKDDLENSVSEENLY